MKFLTTRLSSMRDRVLTTPAVRCLKEQLPLAEVHYVTKPKFKTVTQPKPDIDKIHEHEEDWQKMIGELKAEQFDYIIDLHHNLRTLRVKRDLKVPSFSFNKLNIEKLIFVKLKWNVMPKHLHIIDRYMETIKTFGVENDGK